MSGLESTWEQFIADHRVGDRLDGRVVKVVPFGAFVEVADGVQGLLVVEDATAIGPTVAVRIQEIDTVKQRLAFQPA